MAVFRPKYRDPKTGELRESAVWWYEFIFAGRRYRESANTAKKTVAREVEKKRRAELEAALTGIPIEARKKRLETVGERAEAYLASYGLTHRPKSVAFAKGCAAHLTRLLGDLMVHDLNKERMEAYIRTRLSEDASGRTINAEIGELTRIIGRTWKTLWPKLKKLDENHEAGRCLTPDEENRLLSAAGAGGWVISVMIRLALSTGMRQGEITELRWSQVDLFADSLTVGKAKTDAGTGRQIPLNASLKALLVTHLDWYRQAFGDPRPEWHLFPFGVRAGKGKAKDPGKAHGVKMDPARPITCIKKAWEMVREDAGVECRFHDLRHSACTKLAEAGVPESTMLAIMGHMSRAMLERYSHIRMKAKRAAVVALELPASEAPPKESPKVTEPPKVL